MSLEGQQFGKYQLKRLLGSGGLGEVYLAEHVDIHQQVAIKVIRPDIISPLDSTIAKNALRLFLREAEAIAKLKHPHILPLYSFDETKINGFSLPYMIMEYCPESSLDKWVDQQSSTKALPPQDVAHFLMQASDALQDAHDNYIIHQDVKPQNFLIRSNKHSHLPDLMLADFGMARFINPDIRQSQSIRGTPAYMAPEQWEGKPECASDQYALAIMAYELLTGELPFQRQIMHHHMTIEPPPPSLMKPDIPKQLDSVILRALKKDPAERYPSVTEFARAFQEALSTANLTINESEAIAGTTRTLTLDDGRMVTVSIPPNTQNGQVLRLEGPMGPVIVTVTINRTSVNSFAQIIDYVSPFLKPSWPPSRKLVPILIGLVLLVILGSVVPLYAISQNTAQRTIAETATASSATHTVQVHATQTASAATAYANETATANAYANETATAIAQSNEIASAATAYANETVTANATATFVTNPYPPHTGILSLFDPLIDNSKGQNWNEETQGTPRCQFIGGSYHAIDSTSQYYDFCFAHASNFSNFAYQVEMKILSGDCGGLLFRANSAQNNTYIFEVCQDRRYRLDIHTSKPTDHFLLGFYTNAAIKGGYNQTNVIAIVAKGNTIQMYVNNVLVYTASDNTYSQGQIGLLADDAYHPTEVVYANAKVWQL